MKETVKKYAIHILKFLMHNFVYIIWFIFYFIMTRDILALMISDKEGCTAMTVYGYLISAVLLLSPLGEHILRFANGIRRLETEKEKDYLLPIFDDVYEEAKKQYPILSKKIELCIIDAMHINAFALGRKTIAVTKGAVESLSEEELKGFIAHEIGHIFNGDTKAVMIVTIGNGIFSLITIALQKISYLIENFLYARGFLWWIIKTILYLCYIYFTSLVKITLAINSRTNEYRADKFAYTIGYGNNLKNSLYLLQGMCISDKATLVERLKHSHPNIARRIGRLEKFINEELESETTEA